MIRIKHKPIKRSSGQISRKVSRKWKQQSNNTNRSVDANDTRTISTNWWAGRGRIYPTEFVSPSRPICHASPQRFHVYAITLPPYIHLRMYTFATTPLLLPFLSYLSSYFLSVPFLFTLLCISLSTLIQRSRIVFISRRVARLTARKRQEEKHQGTRVRRLGEGRKGRSFPDE